MFITLIFYLQEENQKKMDRINAEKEVESDKLKKVTDLLEKEKVNFLCCVVYFEFTTIGEKIRSDE